MKNQSIPLCSIRVPGIPIDHYKCLILLLIFILHFSIVLALCLMLSMTHYAGIIGESLPTNPPQVYASL